MTTTYEKLLNLGYSHDEIIKAVSGYHSRCRTFTAVGAETPDGYPLIGISYHCDYRAEEEWGQRAIYKTLGVEPHRWQMKEENKVFISRFRGIPSLILLSNDWDGFDSQEQEWGHSIETSQGIKRATGTLDLDSKFKGKGYSLLEYYDEYYRYAVTDVQKIPDNLQPNEWLKIAELKEIAVKAGIQGKLPTRKDNLIEFIKNAPEFIALAEEPNVWPGWFHNGEALVLRADRGIVADILNILYEASQEGMLACGGGTGPFSTAATFYDARDVGQLLMKERLEKIESIKTTASV